MLAWVNCNQCLFYWFTTHILLLFAHNTIWTHIEKGYTLCAYRIISTFHSNVKSSLLKLLCTLARLCVGTPLQPLRLDFFIIDFPSHPCSQLPFLAFCGQENRTRVKARRSHDRYLLPSVLTPETSPPPISHSPPSKVSSTLCRAISCCHAPLEECFPCFYRNALTLLFLSYFHNGRGRGGILDRRRGTWPSGSHKSFKR